MLFVCATHLPFHITAYAFFAPTFSYERTQPTEMFSRVTKTTNQQTSFAFFFFSLLSSQTHTSYPRARTQPRPKFTNDRIVWFRFKQFKPGLCDKLPATVCGNPSKISICVLRLCSCELPLRYSTFLHKVLK